ncbi:tellurite resistance/C4-dicarboxylate transporter family protein [Aliifodinibius sp. S!AR15-10]|uniref:tellurite resistance/C4-dicarboxylate transporter family protein n=1 Tax=Aliifodinibius sp. S!AR15-10 TaxID=2950437 RepID=UPI00285D30DF|nr:tellurite resistance/C4-dicarboxylate transporter family protein [Aliifodinibius sp. S!AR15-10]MDR8390748.1 tellurite resistance/C4-dicarboxylate transporter family protein [Aliifodinibius sp. S!AR15-10]
MIARLNIIKRYIYNYGIKDLFPGYFALVMATGIVSIAAHLLGFFTIANSLFVLNNFFYFFLLICLLLRLYYCLPEFKEDLFDHLKGPGFFTVIAGTNILGSQYYLFTDHIVISTSLWGLGTLLWLVISYTFFTAITVKEVPPNLEKGISGAWLIAIVATQSVAILGTYLASTTGPLEELLLFLMTCIFLAGCMLYILVITLIFYRFSFFKLSPEDLSPPYWINMGAVAITTLAGSTLLLYSEGSPFLISVEPFLKGFTLFFWSIGTWWIPLLLILGYWRHVVHDVPFPWQSGGYDPSYWGMVFPLGMYTACTWRLAEALDLHFLFTVPRVFIYIAIASWIAIFMGLVRMIFRDLSSTDVHTVFSES